MSDFPSTWVNPPVIGTISREAVPGVNSGLASAAWPTANKAIYVPFTLRAPFLVRRLWWANGATVSGNVDCGVYSQDQVRLFSTGATAQAGASAVQSVALGTAVLLAPGQYFMGLSLSGTATIQMPNPAAIGILILLGVAEQASAHPLPATATMARIGSNKIPACGITSQTVI